MPMGRTPRSIPTRPATCWAASTGAHAAVLGVAWLLGAGAWVATTPVRPLGPLQVRFAGEPAVPPGPILPSADPEETPPADGSLLTVPVVEVRDETPLARPESTPAALPAPRFATSQRVTPPPTPPSAPPAASIRPAHPRTNPPPDYPREARRRGWEGMVVVRCDVDADGRVTDARVTSGSGHEVLDEAAREAVLRWTFDPGRRDGRPVASSVEIPFRFVLTD